ncbi:MAG: non-canonical purine NTP pyrophosphatase [Phycisphaerae bacterium]|nr:non-canonical purine NTP pyrophosphatase [Phycisphaerae bacterium]MDG1898719.1 non-canonical purine NTP pyrophosphatase [Phycisphaerales bacterium]
MAEPTRRILLATSNPHKLDEVRAVLGPLGFEVSSLDDVPGSHPEPVEDADTFEGNARIKAVEYARSTSLRCLADDSGLEVDALHGAPGVHSARYAGVDGDRADRDGANNDKLLAALADVPDELRSARFVCCMCLADPDGSIVAETRGTFDGTVIRTPAGENGFGYDPLLFIPELGCTSAELPPHEKNARSHRGDATRKMAERLM